MMLNVEHSVCTANERVPTSARCAMQGWGWERCRAGADLGHRRRVPHSKQSLAAAAGLRAGCRLLLH